MGYETIYQSLGYVVVICPALLVLILSVNSFLQTEISEPAIGRFVRILTAAALISALTILVMMLMRGERNVTITPWNWVSVESDSHSSVTVPHDEHAAQKSDINHPHFHFEVKFVFDRLSVPFVLLTFILCATIGAFATSYLHREMGYRRFFVLFSLFQLGMIVSALAGSIETLFVGWELVGLSSALLVAFYHERRGPVQNSLRIWGVYRVADAAFLLAAILMHQLPGEGGFAALMGQEPWPASSVTITSQQIFLVGILLLIAAAGKSALIPFSGWLPRAMEGPTPSSAIFYGALSVHLGVYLLLRVSPILSLSTPLSVIVVLLGGVTALMATLAGRVQTDIKSSLSFASLTQVGIIVVEVGFGLHYLALIHLLGHACLRTLQLIRAPSLLIDYKTISDAVGDHKIEPDQSSLPHLFWYRMGYERAFLDFSLDKLILNPFIAAFRQFDKWERGWTTWLGGSSREKLGNIGEYGLPKSIEEDSNTVEESQNSNPTTLAENIYE